MFILDLSLTNLIAYGISLLLVTQALGHWFAARALRRNIKDSEEQLQGYLEEFFLPRNQALIKQVQWGTHPSARVLVTICDQPRFTKNPDTLDEMIVGAIRKATGRLVDSMELIKTIAPMIGISSTVFGFMLVCYNLSGARDPQSQSAVWQSISVALVPTLFGGIAAMIESWIMLTNTDRLQEELLRHGRLTVARYIESLRPSVEAAENKPKAVTPFRREKRRPEPNDHAKTP